MSKLILHIFIGEIPSSYVGHMFSISVFEEWIYWTNWHSDTFLKANKYTGKNITKISPDKHAGSFMAIKVYHPYRQLPSEYIFSFIIDFHTKGMQI